MVLTTDCVSFSTSYSQFWWNRKKESLINSAEAKEQRVELIKRFTGGGTVVLDHDSILVSLICEVRYGESDFRLSVKVIFNVDSYPYVTLAY